MTDSDGFIQDMRYGKIAVFGAYSATAVGYGFVHRGFVEDKMEPITIQPC